MPSNTFLKISNIVNKTEKKVTPQFRKAFMEEYHPSYSSLENYGKSVLEFILKKYGIAKQKTWEHDSIFNFALDIKIDWKVINKKTGNASITSKDKKGNTTKNRDSTHYGFIEMEGDPFQVGSVLKFKLFEIVDKDTVWNNPYKVYEKYFVYKPKNNLHLQENVV